MHAGRDTTLAVAGGELWFLFAEVEFPQSFCPSVHPVCVLSLAARRPSLEYRYMQRLSCNHTYSQGQDRGFRLLQSETIRETQMLSEVSLLMKGGLCFSVGF